VRNEWSNNTSRLCSPWSPFWESEVNDGIESKYSYESDEYSESYFFIIIIFFVYSIEPESDKEYCSINNNELTSNLDETSIFWRYESTSPLKEGEVECKEVIDDIHSRGIVSDE
jgi:hypothetical protein